MLRNPLEVAQGAKRSFWGLLWSCPKMCNESLLYYYFVGVHMIVVFRNFGVALFCTDGGKKCHQAKSLWNMNCEIAWRLEFFGHYVEFWFQNFTCSIGIAFRVLINIVEQEKKGTKVYINSKTKEIPSMTWVWRKEIHGWWEFEW